MRLIVTGKAQSGKSAALERIVRTALRGQWAHILIVDGNTGRVMRSSAAGRLRVTESVEPKEVVRMLTEAADRITMRCAARPYGAGAPAQAERELLVVDEAQEYTRVGGALGTAARSAITRIFERAADLDDLVVVSTQRATGALPPGARGNASAELRMLGSGFCQLAAPGASPAQGRVSPKAPLAEVADLAPAGLMRALCGDGEQPQAPTLITRYEGGPGSGRTYALNNHAGATPGLRRVYLDIKEFSHKALLVACLEQCGAAPPEGTRVSIAELGEMAAVALRATPTLLLLDNCDTVSARAVDTVQRLLDAAAEAAISLAPPPRNAARDLAAPIRRRAALVEIKPLDAARAEGLVRQVAPSLDDASAQAVVQRSSGNPQAITAFAGRVAAHGADERHKLESASPPARWLNLLLMFAALVVVLFIQRSVSHDLAGAALTAAFFVTMWFIRPRINAAMRP